MFYAPYDSPIGRLWIAGSDAGLQRLAFATRFEPPRAWRRDPRAARTVVEQLNDYFAHGLERFEVPLAAEGTPFQRAVWHALTRVGYGQTSSYAELARTVGRPNACRAVGAANANNPLAIVVPCHRVIGSDGRLTGYAGGLDAKRWLLDHEQRTRPRQSPKIAWQASSFA